MLIFPGRAARSFSYRFLTNGRNTMKTIGLLGGMSWESSAVYYRRINENIRDRFGGLHSAEVLMRSVNFDTIVALQQRGAWDQAGAILARLAKDLEQAGADCIVIC